MGAYGAFALFSAWTFRSRSLSGDTKPTSPTPRPHYQLGICAGRFRRVVQFHGGGQHTRPRIDHRESAVHVLSAKSSEYADGYDASTRAHVWISPPVTRIHARLPAGKFGDSLP